MACMICFYYNVCDCHAFIKGNLRTYLHTRRKTANRLTDKLWLRAGGEEEKQRWNHSQSLSPSSPFPNSPESRTHKSEADSMIFC